MRERESERERERDYSIECVEGRISVVATRDC